tara:strand:- start:303 stop:701 length:399 start_codon:yes stop_codon:yes gene_type:complete
MKKVALIFILSYFIMGSSLLVTAGSLSPDYDMFKGNGGSPAKPEPKPEQINPLSDIMLYCNTRDFINNMVNNDYHMNIAAKGSVNGDRHKEIIETHLWMNPSNNQWAIVFVYKEIDRSCVIGGNNIKLYSPK